MPSLPISKTQVLDLYFLEHRAKLLDLAAFLDRYDRASGAGDGPADFRIDAIRASIKILSDTEPGRARRVQESLSDRSAHPIPVAPGKGALGAAPPASDATVGGGGAQ